MGHCTHTRNEGLRQFGLAILALLAATIAAVPISQRLGEAP
jgi:hypothetical protein